MSGNWYLDLLTVIGTAVMGWLVRHWSGPSSAPPNASQADQTPTKPGGSPQQ